MKKILLIVSLILFLNCNLSADKLHIYDYAGYLSDTERQNIEKKLSAISDTYAIDLIVLTYEELNGVDPQDYAESFYDNNNFKDDGLILLIDIYEGWYAVSISGEAMNFISDDEIDIIVQDYMADYLYSGDYYKAFEVFCDKFDYYYKYNNSHAVSSTKTISGTNIAISLVCSGIVSLIVALILKGQLHTANKQNLAMNYIDQGSFIITGYSDYLINTRISKTPISNNNSNGRMNNGNRSAHISSSGISHKGHSGRL